MVGELSRQVDEFYIDIRIAKQNLTPLISGYIHYNIYDQLDDLALEIEKFVHERRNFANDLLLLLEPLLWKRLTVRQKVILDAHEKPPSDGHGDAIHYRAVAFIIEYWVCKELPAFDPCLSAFRLPNKFLLLDKFIAEVGISKIENEKLIEHFGEMIATQKFFKSINRLKEDHFGRGNKKKGLFFWMLSPGEAQCTEPRVPDFKEKPMEGRIVSTEASLPSPDQSSPSVKLFNRPNVPAVATVLRHNNITILYSDVLKMPLWTSQVLNLCELRRRDYSIRVEDIQKELHASSTCAAGGHESNEFERSQLIESRYYKFDRDTLEFTFCLENAVLRHASLNRPGGLWCQLADYLDKRACDYFIEQVLVFTGCLSVYNTTRVVEDKCVTVPSHFYQVFIFNCRGKAVMESYLIPNSDSPAKTSINDCLTPLVDIEKAAGYPIVTDFDRSKLSKVNGSTNAISISNQVLT